MYVIIIAVALAVIASVLDWQLEKTSLLRAWEKYWIKYIAVAAGCFAVAYIPSWAWPILAGCAVYFWWSFFVSLFTKK